MIRDLQANPTAAGGVVRFNLANARVVVEYDDHGNRLSETIETLSAQSPAPTAATTAPTDPLRLLTDAQRATVAERRAVCEGCPENGGLTALTVKCNGCGCAGLSLVSGTCKLEKWP